MGGLRSRRSEPSERSLKAIRDRAGNGRYAALRFRQLFSQQQGENGSHRSNAGQEQRGPGCLVMVMLAHLYRRKHFNHLN